LKQVNIPGIQFFSLFVEAYTFQAGTVILGIEGDILVMLREGVRQYLHVQPEQAVFLLWIER